MKREMLIGGSAAGGPAEPARLSLDALTTHGVILGMTGSGKTGLAVVILEELARHGVPQLVCDLKGDLTNLLLTFPQLRPADFAPYLPVGVAAAERESAAEETAAKWRRGLEEWSIGEAEIRSVRERVSWRLLVPGSGVAPVSLLPALEPPAGYDPDVDPDGAQARLNGTAAGLLALVGRGGDPLTDRDHVLVATLLDHAWRRKGTLDLPELIRQIADPPVGQFGVLDAETFYPGRERQALLQAFNTVLASPGFAAWTRGVPLAMPELLGSPEEPRASILYLAHLADRERLSFLTLLFSELLSWTRAQPGSENLRALLYIDEVQGILPPSAMPATKPPLLTLLKQGRAFGTGVLLATQNPVDLDYKALGNIGVKLVGRLDTENDRRRALEGLDVAGSGIDAVVAELAPRRFLLAGARVGAPRAIRSRWAMSYLRGPMTIRELKPLVGASSIIAAAAPARPRPPAPLVSGVDQAFGAGATLFPHVLVEAEVVYRKASPPVERRVEGAWCIRMVDGEGAWAGMRPVNASALVPVQPAGTVLGPLPPDSGRQLTSAEKGFIAEIDSRAIEVLWNRSVKLVQEEGESAEAFAARCRAAAPDGGAKVLALRRRLETALERLDGKLARKRMDLQHWQ
ncbi:MAG: ATP-binding protein, partial [Acidobacteriota bacterium]